MARNAESNDKVLRKFGLTLGLSLVIVFGTLFPLLKKHPFPIWPWVVALPLAAVSLLKPTALGPLYKAWMKVGSVLAWINTRILLGIVFLVLIIPVGILMRLLNRNPIITASSKTTGTYRIIKDREITAETMRRPF